MNKGNIAFERKFYFENATRSFYSTMHIDLENNRALDRFGKPALISADLDFKVTKDGSLITKSGAQSMFVPYKEIPSPRVLSTRGQPIDGYDEEREVFAFGKTQFKKSAVH